MMGPSEAIGSSFCKCNVPILGHWEHLSEYKLAQAKPSAVAVAIAMGPSKDVGSTSQKY